MTERKVNYALKRISKSRTSGFLHEAFIHAYLLNLSLMRFIFNHISPDTQASSKKAKALLHALIREIEKHPEHKTIISRRNLKVLKPWLQKAEEYFKSTRSGTLVKPDELVEECEKI